MFSGAINECSVGECSVGECSVDEVQWVALMCVQWGH